MAFTYSLDDFAVTFFVTGNGFDLVCWDLLTGSSRDFIEYQCPFCLGLPLQYLTGGWLYFITRERGGDSMKKLYSFLLGIVVVTPCLAGLSARLEAKTNPKTVTSWSSTTGETISIQNCSGNLPRRQAFKSNTIPFDSNEAMYTKIKQGGDNLRYSDSKWIHDRQDDGRNSLEKLDKSKPKGSDNIDPCFLNLDFDPDNQYSVLTSGDPLVSYTTPRWSTKAPEHWADLWRPEYKNDIMMYDGAREVMGIGLNSLGYSLQLQGSSAITRVCW